MPSRNPVQRFQDIIDNIDWIEADTRGITRELFMGNRTIQDAVMFCFLRISEAARKLDKLAEELAPDQPCFNIRRFGNHLRHGYDDIDRDLVWKTIRDDLPTLRKACGEAIENLRGRQSGNGDG